MVVYQKNNTYMGSQITTFNSFIGNLHNPELKIVVLQEKQFTLDNLKTLLEKKAYGVCVILQNIDGFVASKKWMEAYRFSCRLFSHLVENNHHMPLYFLDERNTSSSRFASLDSDSNLKLIAGTSLGTSHSKLKLVDFVVP